MKIYTFDPRFVTCEGPQKLGGLQVPDLESSRLTASTDQLLGGAEPHALNAGVVTCNVQL